MGAGSQAGRALRGGLSHGGCRLTSRTCPARRAVARWVPAHKPDVPRAAGFRTVGAGSHVVRAAGFRTVGAGSHVVRAAGFRTVGAGSHVVRAPPWWERLRTASTPRNVKLLGG